MEATSGSRSGYTHHRHIAQRVLRACIEAKRSVAGRRRTPQRNCLNSGPPRRPFRGASRRSIPRYRWCAALAAARCCLPGRWARFAVPGRRRNSGRPALPLLQTRNATPAARRQSGTGVAHRAQCGRAPRRPTSAPGGPRVEPQSRRAAQTPRAGWPRPEMGVPHMMSAFSTHSCGSPPSRSPRTTNLWWGWRALLLGE